MYNVHLIASTRLVSFTIDKFKRSRDRLMNVRQTTRLLTEDVDRLVAELHLSDEARAQAEAEALQEAPTHVGIGAYDETIGGTGAAGADGGY